MHIASRLTAHGPDGAEQTEIERLRGELAATEDRLRLHLAQTPAAIMEVRPDGRTVLWNAAAERIFGWSAAEAIGADPITLVVPPELQPDIRQLYARMLCDGQPASGVNRNVRRSGETIHCEWHNTPLIDRAGNIVGIASLALDVTDQVRALHELSTSRERYALALHGTSDGIWDRNLLTNEVEFSERFWTMLGYHPGELEALGLLRSCNDAFRAAVHPDDLAGVVKAERDHLEGLTSDYETTFRMRRKDGSWVWILSRAQALRDAEGIPYRMVGAHTDIDDRVRLERKLRAAQSRSEEASRAKTLFLANMSHELRTPLNAIIGFSEMIASEILGPVGLAAYAEYGRHINDSGKHLLAIINDVLDMSKIEAGKMELVLEPVGVRALAQGCMNMLSGIAADRRVRMEAVFDPPDLTLYADVRALKQIILNLLSNAIKFTPADGVARLSFLRNAEGEPMIVVTDNGIGMHVHQIAKALEPFGQLNDGLARNYSGTGLGLSIVNGLVHLHGGRLELDSEPEVGTTARVVLPPHCAMPPQG